MTGGQSLYFEPETTAADVDAWLAGHKPTRGGYGHDWIHVRDRVTAAPTPDPARNLDGRYRERAVIVGERYMAAWDAQGSTSSKGQALFATFIEESSTLARQYDQRSGKWTVYVGVDDVDEVWARVVRAMALPDGSLRGVAYAAKTGARPGGDGYGGQCAVLVYVRDAFDLVNVKTCLLGLIDATGREIGGFKLDTATAAQVKRPAGSSSQLLTSLCAPARSLGQSR